MNEDQNIVRSVKEIIQSILKANFGSSFNVVLNFYFKQEFNRDPYEVLWENPGVFYTKLEKMFGSGAEAIIALISRGLTEKYTSISFTFEEFLRLMRDGDKSSRDRLREIFREIVKHHLAGGDDVGEE